MAYTSQTKIENYLGRSLSAAEVSYLTVLLPAVDDFINKYTGTSFNAATSPAYYDGTGSRYLYIDPFQTISSIKPVTYDVDGNEEVDDTYVANVDYRPFPLNSTVIDTLYRLNAKWTGRYKITGTPGYATVPEAIQHAATLLSSGYLSGGGAGNLKRESIEGYTREFFDTSSDAEEVAVALDQYRNLAV